MRLRNQRGQLVVEYVLLLLVVVVIATTLVKGLISQDESEPGALVRAWQTMITIVGNDSAGEVN